MGTYLSSCILQSSVLGRLQTEGHRQKFSMNIFHIRSNFKLLALGNSLSGESHLTEGKFVDLLVISGFW